MAGPGFPREGPYRTPAEQINMPEKEDTRLKEIIQKLILNAKDWKVDNSGYRYNNFWMNQSETLYYKQFKIADYTKTKDLKKTIIQAKTAEAWKELHTKGTL